MKDFLTLQADILKKSLVSLVQIAEQATQETRRAWMMDEISVDDAVGQIHLLTRDIQNALNMLVELTRLCHSNDQNDEPKSAVR